MSGKVVKNSPFLKSLNSLRDLPDHVIVESFKVVDKFIQNSESEPIHLFLKSSLEGRYSFQGLFETISFIADHEFEKLTGYRYNSGVVAIFRKPEFIAEEEVTFPMIILNGLTKVENVGAIVRSATAFGFNCLVIDDKTCSPFLRRAIRVSMGNIALLKVHRSADLVSFINKCEYPIYATANLSDSLNFNEWLPELKSGIVIGSEGHGIDEDVLKICSNTIRIPINKSVEHLNASAAAAIICSKYSLLDTSK